MFKKLIALALLATVGGCAFGNTIDYQSRPPTLAAKSDKPVAVGVDDKRPYVVAKNNTPEWVGLVRSGVGIPYGVHTTSGKPLASDFATAIATALKANGINASVVTVPVSSNDDQAIKLLSESGAPRTLLVTMKQWKTDKYFHSKLDVSLQADVRDGAGRLLASNSVDNTQSVGGFWTIAAEQGSVDAAREVLTRLLDDAKIVEALK
jgi:ABC-type transport system substrate-binding protein